ncbi:MAG: hypothetical protein M1837_006167 [Sclerophora amabilis]|nr:MAG: hypothetical protein M1837_006167 [Sclerophora amabilis]
MASRKRKLSTNMSPVPPSSPPLAPPQLRTATPETMSDTMAPPESSGSSPQPPQAAKSAQRPKNRGINKKPPTRSRRKQPARTPQILSRNHDVPNDDSPLSSPNHNSSKTSDVISKRKPQTLATATLKDLLPRRRRRRRHHAHGEFDIISSSDGEHGDGTMMSHNIDEDELSRPPRTKRVMSTKRNTKSVPPTASKFPESRQSTSTKGAKKHLNAAIISSSKNYQKSSPLKPKTPQLAKETPPSKTYTRTHRRRYGSSDKENDDDDNYVGFGNDSLDPTLSDHDVEVPDDGRGLDHTVNGKGKKGLEVRAEKAGEKALREAARKFREVDKWELDFEEASMESSGRSSQVDAR